jgi:hypothetical protein
VPQVSRNISVCLFVCFFLDCFVWTSGGSGTTPEAARSSKPSCGLECSRQVQEQRGEFFLVRGHPLYHVGHSQSGRLFSTVAEIGEQAGKDVRGHPVYNGGHFSNQGDFPSTMG